MGKENTYLPGELARLCHSQWSGWMEYLFTQGTFNEDGTWTMPAWAVERWTRQMNMNYDQLSEEEQYSDLNEASRIHKVVYDHFHWAMKRMDQALVDLGTVCAEYTRLGLGGVAEALQRITWKIVSTAGLMLRDWEHSAPDAHR